MLLRSGRATSPTIGPRRRSFRCGSSCSSVEAARRLVGLLPRKGSAARRLKSRSPPASPEKQPVTPPSPEVPVEAPLTPAQYRSPGEDGSSRASVEDESPPGVIKRSVDDEPSPTRRVKSRSPPEPSQKQLIALPLPEAGAGVTLHPPKVGTLAQHGGAGEDGTDEGSIAELGIKLFPCLPPDQAAALWVGFVNDAKTCIKQYNIKHKANFVYKHEPSNGFYRVEEQDGRAYYHTNFYAQDEYGHSQLFFGEIEECVRPQVEDVTCCCPVSSFDSGGVGFRTVEEALMYDFPDFRNVGYDAENCYACTARVKHPKGTLYVGGHFADVRQYYGFSD